MIANITKQELYKLLIVVLIFTSCSKDPGSIPDFLQSSSPKFISFLSTDSTEHNLTDYWVYQDNELIGVFDIRQRIPLFGTGISQLSIFPGVRVNGSRDEAYIYPFLSNFKTEVELCGCDRLIEIDPSFGYSPSSKFSLATDFEVGNDFGTDLDNDPMSMLVLQNDTAFYSNTAGLIEVNKDHPSNIVANQQFSTEIEQFGREVFLEVNHKSNIPFVIGILVNSDLETYYEPIYIANSSKDWKKLYLDLSETINQNKATGGYKIVFQAQYPSTLEDQSGRVYIDNVKLVHF